MSKQISSYEKKLFELIREYNHRFYYESIFRIIEEDNYKIKVEKKREEMVGRALVTLPNGEKIEYEIRYNRIVNLNANYTLLLPGAKTG